MNFYTVVMPNRKRLRVQAPDLRTAFYAARVADMSRAPVRDVEPKPVLTIDNKSNGAGDRLLDLPAFLRRQAE